MDTSIINEENTGEGKTFAQKQAERLKKLRDLHRLRNEARSHNHQEVIAEDARNKLPSNWENRKRKAEWILNDQKEREEAAKKGEDYDRVKLLNVSAVEAERLEKLKKKKNPDQGFSDFEAAAVRQYNRLIKGLAPKDMEVYEEQKAKYGDAFYAGLNTIVHGLHKDRPAAVDNLVKSVEEQIAKRSKYSRRRIHNDDADIDYINERNAKFNKKMDRFYGEHTAEIKQNLERGTAV
ncbi:pre-mRNA-splicing factor Syf2 [Anoplophora glabripennis]|uniref:pre-mRNA-splicing factor Syf2 n=1 Tax=Anoplophora glabripennis TaxID=217634 RepID=UPI000874F589|nr:pre-mRNA-splicing factor Syf2 [Anoplophora glabripennis]XP_018563679.1 pre-mRNA-splicing factor Syf2 [Anoplophora glabripennis]